LWRSEAARASPVFDERPTVKFNTASNDPALDVAAAVQEDHFTTDTFLQRPCRPDTNVPFRRGFRSINELPP
jgi:hypothetical protein